MILPGTAIEELPISSSFMLLIYDNICEHITFEWAEQRDKDRWQNLASEKLKPCQ